MMGYISTQEMKAAREEIKKVLPAKDGFKISVTRRHYSTIVVKLVQSPLEIALPANGYRNINNYYLKEIECKATRTIFELIDKAVNRAMGVNYDRNAGDMGADYANCNYYKDYQIGDYNTPCIIKN